MDQETRAHSRNADPATEAGAMLAGLVTDAVPRLRYWRGAWWTWRNGRYDEVIEADVRANVVKALNAKFSHVGTGKLADVMEQLRAQAIVGSHRTAPFWLTTDCRWPAGELLATANEILHLPTICAGCDGRRPATPQLFTTAAVDYHFEPDAPTPARWLEFLGQLWPDDPQAVAALQEWFGYCLTPDTRQQKMLMLLGPRRSGKGTIARVLSAVLGPGNVSGPTLNSLASNFGLAPLLGKSLAIFSDARLSGRTDQAAITENLLRISGEDMVTIDRKHRDSFTCTLPLRIMLISNELPRLTESSGALVGRMIILRLVRSFYGQEDTGLTAALLGERPGILRWAIDGWERLREWGHFRQPASGEALRDELEDLASPVGAFVRECCTIGPEHRTSCDNLYRAWRDWCAEKGREPSSQPIFGKDLIAACPALTKSRPRGDGARFWAYQGIAINIGRF